MPSLGNSYVNKSDGTDPVQSVDGFKEGTSQRGPSKGMYFELVVKEEYVFTRTKSGRRPRQAEGTAQVKSWRHETAIPGLRGAVRKKKDF